MKLSKITIKLACLFVAVALGSSQSAFITQIDPSLLLTEQKNTVYATIQSLVKNSVPNSLEGNLEILESADGKQFIPAGDVTISVDSNVSAGISFLFLLDNSGSMYDTLDGKKTEDLAQTRFFAANRAASNFLLSVTGPTDSIGLAVFNTRYQNLLRPQIDKQTVSAAISSIVRPAREDGYTELYAGITMASTEGETINGRKAMIVLSDGVNYPFKDFENKPSPQFANRSFTAQEALHEAILQGWTIFAVNFGPDAKDSQLSEIAIASGGAVFDAKDDNELIAIYRSIHQSIVQEIRIDYRPLMLDGDKRWVKLRFTDGAQQAESTRYYYVGTVFGQALTLLPPWIYFLMPLALLAWLLLALVKLDKPSSSANLQLLYGPGAVNTNRFLEVGDRTIIGADTTADLTIAGNTQLQTNPVTIVRDTITGKYTLISSSTVVVNNKTVSKKELSPGDVINFNGTIVVFDDKAIVKSKKKPKA